MRTQDTWKNLPKCLLLEDKFPVWFNFEDATMPSTTSYYKCCGSPPPKCEVVPGKWLHHREIHFSIISHPSVAM